MTENSSFSSTKQAATSAWLFFWDLAKVFLVAFGLVWLVIRPFLAEPFIVSGSSMVPNFHNRDYLIVEKISYRRHAPERGDVVIFRYPNDPRQYFIKRIIGLPGDTVSIDDNKVTIKNTALDNEWELREDYLPSDTITEINSSRQWQLAADQYFVLGDNRKHSSDSRIWGPLPGSLIVGKAWLSVLPLDTIGLVEHERPQ